MNLFDINDIKKILSRHGFTFSKGLGQNFLINPDVCPQMAADCGADYDTGVLEIGPGIGVLTRELAGLAQKVVAIELDRRLIPVLGETLAGYDNVTVIQGDVLKLDLREIIAGHFAGMKVVVCANLPYYITSPIIAALLEQRLNISSVTVMVQDEVARRICADIPGRHSSAFTACVHYYARAEMLFKVGRESFVPSPNVDSAVIRLDIHDASPVNATDEKQLFRVIKAAFGQRRKTLLNALSAGLCLPREQTLGLLDRAGVSSTLRAEQLSLQQFADIANVLDFR